MMFVYLFLLIALTSFILLYLVDPYGLFHGNIKHKKLPDYTWYHYNLIRHYKKVDLALIGSSAINYYAEINKDIRSNSVFYMGVESSNIQEHLAYARLLLKKKPKKIIFFYTFYALNPTRGFQAEFKPNMLKYNNYIVDFYTQYCNFRAFKNLGQCIINFFYKSKRPVHLFFQDGRRTQLHYLNRQNYSFDVVIADYLAAMSIDPFYYNSTIFKNPDSLIPGFDQIRQFKQEAEKQGIEMQFVSTPVHRHTLALKYYLGLGETYERFRKEMLHLGSYQDLNLDRDFVSNPNNWWDTHHTRNGDYVIGKILDNSYLVTSNNLEATTIDLRPTQEEIEQVRNILQNYPNWDQLKEKINKRNKLN